MKRADRVNVADDDGPVADPSAHAAYISLTDVSISTEDTRRTYLLDMVTFARRAAHAHALYYADAFGGALHKHARYPVQANFSSEPMGFAGNETLADANRDCDAVSLTVPLRALAQARPGEPGSPLLEMLEMAGALSAQQPGAVPYVALRRARCAHDRHAPQHLTGRPPRTLAACDGRETHIHISFRTPRPRPRPGRPRRRPQTLHAPRRP